MHLLRLIGLSTSLMVAACGSDTRSEVDPPSVAERVPRLTHAQWEATIQDLFGLPAAPGLSSGFVPDPQLGRFDNNIARLGMSAGLWRDYQRAAEAIAERVVLDAALLANIVDDASAIDGRAFVASFGLRAFRRPLTTTEMDRYVALFDGAASLFPEHSAQVAGVRLVVQNMLQSPAFLYRAELSTTRTDIGMPLNGYEVASRLSYLFWNSMPDGELLAAAKDGVLDGAGGVRDQALRLMDHPRTRDQLRRLHYQAYGVAEFEDVDKSTTAFPEWRREIAPMMAEETLRFIDGVIINDGTVADLFTSTKAYVNADLAKIYGVPGTFGSEYVEVELDPATRAGLLTRVGFLARNATLDTPDPIHRGVSINLNILCRPIAAPPNIPDVLPTTGTTNREKVESVTGAGTCGEGCHHAIINPLGFAFEGFDALGAVRTMDAGQPINSTDEYTFLNGRTISFTNAVELSQQLAAAPETHACYTSNILEFMLGRSLDLSDRLLMLQLADRSQKEGLSIKELLLSVVESNAFRVRTVTTRSAQ